MGACLLAASGLEGVGGQCAACVTVCLFASGGFWSHEAKMSACGLLIYCGGFMRL